MITLYIYINEQYLYVDTNIPVRIWIMLMTGITGLMPAKSFWWLRAGAYSLGAIFADSRCSLMGTAHKRKGRKYLNVYYHSDSICGFQADF